MTSEKEQELERSVLSKFELKHMHTPNKGMALNILTPVKCCFLNIKLLLSN